MYSEEFHYMTARQWFGISFCSQIFSKSASSISAVVSTFIFEGFCRNSIWAGCLAVLHLLDGADDLVLLLVDRSLFKCWKDICFENILK
jgi:hypothetical protein